MSNETTDNFWTFMRDWQWPAPQPVEYRLYHDDQGQPLFYTMEHRPGTFITVDQVTYVNSPRNVRVQHGQLIVIPPCVTVSRLRPDADAGTPCTPQDVCIVVEQDQPHRKWKDHANGLS